VTRSPHAVARWEAAGDAAYTPGMDGFNIVVPIEVAFRDVDAMGHTNNAVYLTWFENGRVALWRAITRDEHSDYARVPFVLARAEIDFRAPTFVGERLRLGIRTTRIGGRSFESRYRIERDADGELVAEGTSVQVMYDYRERRSMAMPDDFRARLAEIDDLDP